MSTRPAICLIPGMGNNGKGFGCTRNRVVVTGMGVLAPNGIGLKAFWKSLVAGESGIGPITLFDTTGFKSRIAGEVKNFDPLDYMPREWKPKRMARHTQLAYAAAQMALQDAGLDLTDRQPGNLIVVCIGVSTTAMEVLEAGFDQMRKYGPARVTCFGLGNCQPQAAAQLIAEKLGVEAHASTFSSACPGGLEAIAAAAARIRSGEVDVAIAGGSDAPVTPLSFAAFASSGLSSFANSSPGRASRPYDEMSDTGVISEGAGIVVLENLERAVARGAKRYLEITGYGAQGDYDPNEEFSGLASTMQLALANASRRVDEVDYICGYGPSHAVLDAAEVRVIRRTFGRVADRVPVSSIKGVIGNPLSAGGPLQVIACALAIRNDLIPPTANHDHPREGCDLDFVPKRARNARLDCILINVRGLGGGNSSMVVERVEADEEIIA